MKINSIAISGSPGAGKSSLFCRLQEILGWERFGIGDLLRKDFEASPQKQVISFTEYFKNKQYVSDDKIRALNEELRHRLILGNVLADSRFAALNAKGLSNVLTVYLHAPTKIRAARNMGKERYEGLSLDEIIKDLDIRQAAESERGKEIYGLDFECHRVSDYNMVLDTQIHSIDEELDLILRKIGNNY